MNDNQFKERVATVLREELQLEEDWHYVSFADDVFNGAVIIKAHGVTDALTRIHALNINPGGQVLCIKMPAALVAQVPESDRMRLLLKEDVSRIWPDAKSIGEHEEDDAQK